jgi:hypothetical protein
MDLHFKSAAEINRLIQQFLQSNVRPRSPLLAPAQPAGKFGLWSELNDLRAPRRHPLASQSKLA